MLSFRLGGKKTSEMNWLKRLGKRELEVLVFVKTHGSALREKWSSAMSVKHMMWRLRYQFRQAVGSPRRHGRQTGFGYDPKSYSQNFDDGSWVFSYN
jgi:hypothetical protein